LKTKRWSECKAEERRFWIGLTVLSLILIVGFSYVRAGRLEDDIRRQYQGQYQRQPMQQPQPQYGFGPYQSGQ
jgi:hypothetical protein